MRGRCAFVAAPRGASCPIRASRPEIVRDQWVRGRVPRISTSLPTQTVDKRAPPRDHSTGTAPAASLAIQSRNSVIAGVSGFDFSDVSQ